VVLADQDLLRFATQTLFHWQLQQQVLQLLQHQEDTEFINGLEVGA
jgi:hypothetical protein